MITTAKLFCDGWEFCETPLGASYGDVMSSDAFRPVEIPHDYMIYDTHALYRTGEGWYRPHDTALRGRLHGLDRVRQRRGCV